VSIGQKATLIEVAMIGSFIACAVFVERLPSQAWFVLKVWLCALVVLGTWLWTLDCPRCGHNLTSRPVRWLHDFPIHSVGVFYRRCHWCGYDLRAKPPQLM
jgi:hypothetical protein